MIGKSWDPVDGQWMIGGCKGSLEVEECFGAGFDHGVGDDGVLTRGECGLEVNGELNGGELSRRGALVGFDDREVEDRSDHKNVCEEFGRSKSEHTEDLGAVGEEVGCQDPSNEWGDSCEDGLCVSIVGNADEHHDEKR